MKTNVISINTLKEKYLKHLVVLLLLCICSNVWGVVPTTSELNFGTPSVSADFEGASVTSKSNDNSTTASSGTDLSGYGPFSGYYLGKNANGVLSVAIIDGSSDDEDPMTSKYLALTSSNNAASVTFAHDFVTQGAYSFKITKTSTIQIGLYNGVASGSMSHANAAAFLNFDGGSNIKISAGRNGKSDPDPKGWQIVSSTLPSSDVLDITVVYNTESSSTTYGDGIALAANSAHVYINGTAADDGAGNASDFYIGGNTIAHFRLFDNASGGPRTTCVDDIKIYDALPTSAGNEITLSKNNSDLSGSANGVGQILADATSMTITTAPTRTGYEVEGYYTTSACATKIATSAGALQASITVGGNTWTNSDSEWKRGADETFYTKWTAATYTVTFDKQSGTGGSDNVIATYDAAMPAATMPTREGYNFEGYFTETGGSGTKYYNANGSSATDWKEAANTTLYAHWSAKSYSDYRFSCSELTLTCSAADTVFITSTASKSVRSHEAFHLTGSGLTPSTNFTFSFGNSDLNSRFAFKLADGTTDVSTNSSGAIDADIYVVYTPTSGDTGDGLNKATNLTVTMSGAKPKTTTLNTKTIIGRHLPSQFVIAAKKGGKWYALPSNITNAETATPVEIAVNDADNPTIAYTATTNMYSIAQPSASEYIRLKMKGKSDYPLFGSSGGGTSVGSSKETDAEDADITDGYLWRTIQVNRDASIATNAENAVYRLYSKNKNDSLRIKNSPFVWGLYSWASNSVQDIHLIPASNKTVVEAYFIEYGAAGGVIEVDAGTISATKVLARFNGNTSSKITLNQTLTSGKSRASAYNYTVTFDGGVDFTAATAVGKILMLEWYNSIDEMVGVTSIEIPKIISTGTSTTMSSIGGSGYWKDKEVHVLPGTTLTANTGSLSNAVRIRELHIYPGATVQVTPAGTAGTLTVDTLIMRNGWSRAGTKKYDVARLYIQPYKDASHVAGTLKATNVYADWYIDYDQYYPIAVPWNAATASFTYRYCSVEPSVGPSGNIRLRYYDGASRATNVQDGVGSGANWKAFGADGCDPVPTALTPSHGYIMTAKRPTGKAFSIIRMPLTLPSGTWADGAWTTSGESGSVSTTHKDEIAVTAHNSGSTPGYAQGWNLIANPYMALHQGALTYNDGSGDEIEYANVPDINFTEYDQLPIATTKLKPSSAFLVQAPKNGTVTFGTANRKASAPSSYRNEAPKASKQKAYILLNGNEAEDQMGIIIGEQYTAAYELNADLEKLLSDGTSLRTYMRYGDRNMAYVAINAMLAKELIPVTVRIPAEGEYTFSLHEASIASELEGIYLTDYLTDVTTNLLYDSYTFTAEAGANAERFAINAIVGERKTPTGVDIPGVDKNGNEPVKFIWHDKVFILHNNVIYDSTGKRVNVINK